MPPTTRRRSSGSTVSSGSLVDLTEANVSSTTRNKRTRTTQDRTENITSLAVDQGRKRRRTDASNNQIESSTATSIASASTRRGPQHDQNNSRPTTREGNRRSSGIDLAALEEVDLTGNAGEENDLAKAIQKQRADQIASQRPSEEKVVKLGNITCVICLEAPTDLTAAVCGHVFCHTCLMEALIAGENRAGPGETKKSQCPVCRKNISRSKQSDTIPLLIMKGLATQTRKKRAGATST